ncbi:uncharacterized protein LOC127848638 [Dreissena polymorpha]|uniref:Uncharacterized protein n=1 Tax=Dreissena polymorpha TaxID=45954 RepID=A0A9D4I9C2_DREPO|nr:uncharacterized protein LOC127848638 [Dreissena polymorpha]XP_052237181.1 uncharacterized protein LOC127848638 [Dreissena polymorpha]KAH3753130.1 hypothetical protein DPMN_187761 [Dreissena polymorpha]
MFVSTYVPYVLMCGVVAQSFATRAQQDVTSQREEGQNIPPSIEDQKMSVDISDTPLILDYQSIFGLNNGRGSNENASLKFSRLSKQEYPNVGKVKQYSSKSNSGTKFSNTLKENGSNIIRGTPRFLLNSKVQEGQDIYQKTDALHLRPKRGFRSAVADRIAHGFGKRSNALDLQNEQWQAVKALLDFSRFEQEVYDDDVNTLVRLYRKYGNRTSNQPLASRPPLSENADAELLKKLLEA